MPIDAHVNYEYTCFVRFSIPGGKRERELNVANTYKKILFIYQNTQSDASLNEFLGNNSPPKG